MKNIFFGAKIIISCLLISFLFFFVLGDKSNVNGGSSSKMMQEVSDVYAYVEKAIKNEGYKITSTSGHFNYLNSKDYDDADLIKYYNKTVPSDREIPKNTGGTCWATAITSVLKYYGAKGKAEDVYCTVIKQGMDDNGKKVLKSGLASSKMSGLLNKLFVSNKIKKTSKTISYSYTDHEKIYNEAVNNYKNKNMGILLGDDHAMSTPGYGYVTCKFKDPNNGKTYSRTKKFIVINWGIMKEEKIDKKSPDNYQFFAVDDINSKFKYVKVLNK